MLTEQSANLEDVWRDVLRRAAARLRSKGVSAALAEDAVQEAVSRAITRAVAFDDADDLLRWINTVAWRVVVDVRRRDRRLVYSEPEAPATDDTAQSAEARISLAKLRVLLGRLSADELAALAPRATADRRESVRWAVRRHRVRARLLALLEGAAALGALVRLRWPERVTPRAAALAAAAPLAAMSVVAVWSGDRETPVPPGHVPSSSSAPVAVSPRHGGEAAAPVAASRQAPSAGPRRTPQPGGIRIDLHPVESDAWARPKQPGDPLVCFTDFIVVGDKCVESPVQITD